MSGIREDVAFAIEQVMPVGALNRLYEMEDCGSLAEAAIAAATPHIRAAAREALFDELIERADNEWERVRKEDPWSPSPAWDITQWLVEQKKQETQP